jgi:hypothetical protein
MSAGLVTLTIKGADGVGRSAQFWSSDGTLTGILEPVTHIEDAQLALLATGAKQDSALASLGAPADAAYSGSGSSGLIAGIKGLYARLGAVVLAAGSAVIGKVGLQVGGADVSVSNFVPTREASIANGASITPDDVATVAAGILFAINCSAPGNVKVKFVGGYTLTFPASAGLTMFPWQIVQVYVTGTTATATFSNLS